MLLLLMRHRWRKDAGEIAKRDSCEKVYKCFVNEDDCGTPSKLSADDPGMTEQ